MTVGGGFAFSIVQLSSPEVTKKTDKLQDGEKKEDANFEKHIVVRWKNPYM